MDEKNRLYHIVYNIPTQVYPGWEEQKEKEIDAYLNYNDFKEAKEVLARIMEMK